MTDNWLMDSVRLNGKLITKYMKEKKVSYGCLAADMEVSTSTLRAMEQGYMPRRCREQILSRLAQRLGISVGALILHTEAMTA